jgi:hypothetical protein
MFLVQAVKQKTSVPNALLRKHCARFEPRDREVFGQFVLQSWLAEDVRPISADEARERASSSAQMWHQSVRQYPQHYANSPYIGYLFHWAQDGAWQGVVQAPGLSLSHRLPTLTSCGSHMACAGRALHEERERLKRGLLSSK